MKPKSSEKLQVSDKTLSSGAHTQKRATKEAKVGDRIWDTASQRLTVLKGDTIIHNEPTLCLREVNPNRNAEQDIADNLMC